MVLYIRKAEGSLLCIYMAVIVSSPGRDSPHVLGT